jgi:hypothetical protein
VAPSTQRLAGELRARLDALEKILDEDERT